MWVLAPPEEGLSTTKEVQQDNLGLRRLKVTSRLIGGYTEVSFGETKVRLQLDSGADVTVINREAWEQIGSPTLEKTTTSLGAANGTPIEVLGQFVVQFTCGGHSDHGRCYVAKISNSCWAVHRVDEPTSTSSEGLQCHLLQD